MEERKIRLLDAEALWGYALKVLGGRAYSSGELREKLRRRAARSGDVDDILARLKDHGYLDDRRFAEGFAASRLSSEKHGRTRVLQDLRQHRIAPSLAERTVKEVYRDVDEEALIEEWIRRKYRLAAARGTFRGGQGPGRRVSPPAPRGLSHRRDREGAQAFRQGPRLAGFLRAAAGGRNLAADERR